MTLRILLQQISSNIQHDCGTFYHDDIYDQILDYELMAFDDVRWGCSAKIKGIELDNEKKEITLLID